LPPPEFGIARQPAPPTILVDETSTAPRSWNLPGFSISGTTVMANLDCPVLRQ
jgi:hypothetical protein